VIKSEETIAIEFERRMRDLAAESKAEAILLQMNPRVSAEFTGNGARVLHAIEEQTGKWFHFEGSEGLPLEHLAVLMEADREKVLERALPFREGEEVHVELVEPHMYSPGDAVAKVDGYMISIVGGGRYVGQKHLVRIDEAGRTAAVASLLDVEPGSAEEAPAPKASGNSSRRRSRQPARSQDGKKPAAERSSAEPEESSPGSDDSAAQEDGLQSKPRRRGRRGGRRRSGARAKSAQPASSSSE
jgi:ribonuclease G